MNKNTFLLFTISITGLITIILLIRNLTDMYAIPNAISTDALIAKMYDWIYFTSLIQIVFTSLTIIMVIYLIMNLRISEPTQHSQKQVKKRRKSKRNAEDDVESSFMKQWRKMEKEAT